MLETLETDLNGRIARYYLPRGTVETPTILPVLDPRNNHVPPNEIKEKFGFNFIITSAYLFLKRYGKPQGDKNIHQIMDFEGNIMMDSGAYQILAYGDVEVKPMESLQIQTILKPDVGVILDVPTPPSDSYLQAKDKTIETVKRVKLALDYISNNKEIIWTLPIQGGQYTNLILEYINEIKSNNYLPYFNFHALGSVAPLMSNYEYRTLFEMIYTTRRNLPKNIPLHLFGAGHPMVFPFIVALGCDTFDSAAYVLFGKSRRYMTINSTYQFEDLEEFPCSCKVCTDWTPKELRKESEDEITRQLALHNLYITKQELNNVKNAIRRGALWELLEQRALSHPKLYEGFIWILNNIKNDFLEENTQITKTFGLKLFNTYSFRRPELTKARNKVVENYSQKNKNIVLIIISGDPNPIIKIKQDQQIMEYISDYCTEKDIFILIPYLGIIPVGLIETYPFTQSIFSGIITNELIDNVIENATQFIMKNNYQKIEILNKDQKNISNSIFNKIKNSLEDLF